MLKRTSWMRACGRGIARAFLPVLLAALVLTTTATASPSGFTPKAVIPENQVDQSLSYFDLRLRPGETQTVRLHVTNAEDRPITALAQLNPASSAANGLIVYSRREVRDESMEVSILEIARVLTPEVAIPAKSTGTVEIAITMPEKEYDGVILGGVLISAEYPPEPGEESSESAEEEQNFSIENRFNYVIGLKVTENDTVVEPDLALKEIAPVLSNFRPAVQVTLQNFNAAIAKQMTVSAQVYGKGSDTPLRELNLTDAEMAPQSTADFMIEWGGSAIKPGTYRLKMRVDWQERFWEWDEEFTIASDDAQGVNDEAIELAEEAADIPLWMILLPICLLFLLLLVLAFILGRRAAKKNQEPKQ